MPLLAAALAAALSLGDVVALLPQAREAAGRFAPRPLLVELRISVEDADPRPVFGFFDGRSEEANDLVVEVACRGGAPSIRVLREPKGGGEPAILELSRVTAAWTALRLAPGETLFKWEPLRLRARADGTPCWRARLKETGPAWFDARTGEHSTACREAFSAR